jgi:hypothetical protein
VRTLNIRHAPIPGITLKVSGALRALIPYEFFYEPISNPKQQEKFSFDKTKNELRRAMLGIKESKIKTRFDMAKNTALRFLGIIGIKQVSYVTESASR